MPAVPDADRFVRALTLYFGDDASPGFSPTAAAEYGFLPPVLQTKVVHCCGYSLWK